MHWFRFYLDEMDFYCLLDLFIGFETQIFLIWIIIGIDDPGLAFTLIEILVHSCHGLQSYKSVPAMRFFSLFKM